MKIDVLLHFGQTVKWQKDDQTSVSERVTYDSDVISTGRYENKNIDVILPFENEVEAGAMID